MSQLKHNAACERSRHKKCVCSCGGKLHGAAHEPESREYDPESRIMTVAMGGEVQKFIEKMAGKTMECWCRTELATAGFDGYPHDGGLADKDGNKWWVSLHCDKCGYDWSFWKVANRAKAKEMPLSA